MLIRNFKIFMLYLAGVLLLWHNFVPHHHPDIPAGILKISKQELQDDHHHHYHHAPSHSHHHESNDEQNSGGPLNVPLHSQTVGDAVVKQISKRFCVAPSAIDYVAWGEIFVLSPGLVRLFLLPSPEVADRVLNGPDNSSHSLRGPPFQIFS